MIIPFECEANSTENIDVSSSSQRVQIADDGRRRTIEVMNNGTATVWIAIGGASITASLTTSRPIGPGVTLVTGGVVKSNEPMYVAAIAAGSTGKIYFTPGTGI